MSYRLRAGDDLADGLRAVLREQLDDAAARLRSDVADDPVEAVHEARKDLKKARALVRLVRSALPSAERREDRLALRDAGRRLSVHRDRDVAGATIDELAAEHPDTVDAATWRLVREALEAAAERAVARPLDEEATLVAMEIETVRERLDARLADADVRWRDVRRGLRRTYRRGRGARALAERVDDPAARHDWRKRVKDRWYHERLLKDAWREVIGAQVDALDELGDLLGREHDLVLLEGRLRTLGDEHDADLAPLVELVAGERAALWLRARDLGARLYAEKPKAYARRLGRYAARWRQESPRDDDSPSRRS